MKTRNPLQEMVRILSKYCQRPLTIVGRRWGSVQDKDRFSFDFEPGMPPEIICPACKGTGKASEGGKP